MRAEILRMDDATLEKELAFAEGFSPPTTESEQNWLEELNTEKQCRIESRIERSDRKESQT